MPTVAVSTGVDLYYEEFGTGEPLVLIMGTGTDHAGWTLQIDAYAAEYRCVVFDNRGVGQSSKPETDDAYSMELLADDTAALMDAVGIERAHVSGVSLGSAVTQQLALRHPDKCATLQMHGTWARTDEWLRRACDLRRLMLAHFDRTEVATLTGIYGTSVDMYRNKPHVVELLEQLARDNPHPPTNKSLSGQWWADRNHDTLEDLHRITQPTLVTAGERDMMVPIQLTQEVADNLPNCEFHIFRGPTASHIPIVEEPAAFTELTLDFLRRHPMAA